MGGHLSRLTLDQLRVWVTVVEAGSFSAAGRRLGKVQSAISQSVATLEDTLGVSIFDRSAGRGRLTAEGQALMPEVRAILSAVGRLGGQAHAIAAGTEPELSIVSDAVFPRAVMVELCRRVATQFPALSLRIESAVLGGVVDRVVSGACSLGIVGQDAALPAGLDRVAVGAVQMVPVASVRHPLAGRPALGLDALQEHVQIVLQGPEPTTPDRAVLSTRTWRVADIGTKRDMIEAALGWGNLPAPQIAEAVDRGALVPLDIAAWGPDQHRLALSVVHRREQGLGPASQWALRTLQSLCAEPNAA
ncbi:MAG: LysR family transcriptional regulator [Myxococcota bacterium]